VAARQSESGECRENVMKHILTTALFLTPGAAVAACYATRGVGQDIEATGQKIGESAEITKDKKSSKDS